MKQLCLPLCILLLLCSSTIVFSMSQGPDDGQVAVLQAQDSTPASSVRVRNAQKTLKDWAKSKGWIKFSWDADKERIMIIQQVGATITPDDDFMQKRESYYIEAQLLAKAKIIEAFNTEASAENILSIPGNPIAKQLADQQKKLKDLLKKKERFFCEARSEAQELLAAVDAAQAQELKGVTTKDRLNSLLDAAIKKLDESYNGDNVAEEKKVRVADLKLRLQKAREYEADAQQKKDEIEEQLLAIQGSIKKEQRSNVETLSEMPLFGAVVLNQTESYDELREQYTIAILMVWSPKLEKEARSILLGEGTRKERPTKMTLEGWLDKQNLEVMVGSRRYLSSDGSINFVGISAKEYDPDDMGTYSDAEMEAELWAKQYAILSLMADVKSHKSAERLRRDIVGKDGKTVSKVFSSMSAEIRESVQGLQLRGLEIVRTEELVNPASGKSIIVAVASINSALAIRSSDMMKDTYATLREINRKQSYMQGEVEGMQAAAEETRNDPSAHRQGHADGSAGVQQEDMHRQQPKAVSQPGTTNNGYNFTSQSANVQGSKSGSWGSDADVDDDF